MANQAEIKAVITADDRASATLSKFTHGTLGGIETGLKTLAVGLAIGGAAATAFGVSSVKAFEESEDTLAQLNAVLKSTGSVAGVTADQAVKLAKSLQATTKFSDEAVLSAENLLLTFTSIGKDIFPQATKTVLNMATALGEDTKSAAIQLGKALQDPVLGITALRRVGVNFSDAQKDVISKLVETGQKAEAQKLILKELETEFGGSAEAAGKTFAGSLAKLSNAFNDLQEVVGGAIVQAITPFVTEISKFVSSDEFQQWIERATAKFGELTGRFFDFISRIWPTMKAVWGELIATIRDWIIPLLHDAKNALKEFNDQHPGLLLIAAGVAAIGLAFAVNPIGAAILAIAGAIIYLHHVWEENAEAIKQKWWEVQFFFINTDMGKAILQPFVKAFNEIRANLGPIMAELKEFWKNNKDTIVTVAAAIGAAIYTSMVISAGAVNFLVAAFRVLLDIVNKVQSVFNSVRNASSDLGKWVAQAVGIKPRALGGPVSSNTPYLVGEHGPELFMPNGSGKVVPTQQTQDILSGGSGGSTINLNVNVGVYAGTDVEKRKVAQSLFDSLQDIARSKNMTVGEMMS